MESSIPASAALPATLTFGLLAQVTPLAAPDPLLHGVMLGPCEGIQPVERVGTTDTEYLDRVSGVMRCTFT